MTILLQNQKTRIFIPFKQKPAVEGNNMVLTITNPAGSASVDRFYDYSTILTTFDGDATDNAWNPECFLCRCW